ncbi:MAG TPA: hypothetical protein VMV10_18770 [Pirellulales bacterium]|nr:hypothetical protein [Pirellulales bacterium]
MILRSQMRLSGRQTRGFGKLRSARLRQPSNDLAFALGRGASRGYRRGGLLAITSDSGCCGSLTGQAA